MLVGLDLGLVVGVQPGSSLFDGDTRTEAGRGCLQQIQQHIEQAALDRERQAGAGGAAAEVMPRPDL